jgi:hypothetical protein
MGYRPISFEILSPADSCKSCCLCTVHCALQEGKLRRECYTVREAVHDGIFRQYKAVHAVLSGVKGFQCVDTCTCSLMRFKFEVSHKVSYSWIWQFVYRILSVSFQHMKGQESCSTCAECQEQQDSCRWNEMCGKQQSLSSSS